MTTERQKVIIIGGGITGLTTAYYMQKEARENDLALDVVLVEANLRVGGKIHTMRKNGFIIERGPESFYDRRDNVRLLAKDLGIEDQLIKSEIGKAYVAVGSQFYPIPKSLMRGASAQPSTFLTSRLFSLSGKFRAAGDFILPRSNLEQDQPLGDFFRRRFGAEVVENLVEPLLAGIFAGDVEQLSLKSTFPEFYELEKKYRSILVGMTKTGLKSITNTDQDSFGIFQTFKNGLGTLVETIEASLLSGTILKGVKVEGIEKEIDGKMSIYFNNISPMKADAVVFATSFNIMKKIFEPHQLFKQFSPMKAATIATVTMAFEENQISDIDATNFFVSRNSDFAITSCTFSNRKWPTSTPQGYKLLRSYIGRVGDEAIVELSDSEIEKTVLQDLNKSMTVTGEPYVTVVSRWNKAMPQYTVGHKERVKAIKEELHTHFPNVRMAGSSYEGISIPECVEQGRLVAIELIGNLFAK